MNVGKGLRAQSVMHAFYNWHNPLPKSCQNHACVQGEVQQLKQSNADLGQQLAASEMRDPHPRSPLKQLPVPCQPSALKGTTNSSALPVSPSQAKLARQQDPSSPGQGKAMHAEQSQNGLVGSGAEDGCEVEQGEIRLQTLRKQLKRSAAQCEALKAEVAELKRRDRTADLYKKKVR